MPVYLDHAATTPMSPEAVTAYAQAMTIVGNPSSIHTNGQQAKQTLEEAREAVALALGCDPVEVVFTSGGTEAVNLAIKGLFWARNGEQGPTAVRRRPRILVPEGEHHATIDSVGWLERFEGAVVEWLPLDREGRIDLSAAHDAVTREPDSIALLTALWVNNEVGTIHNVQELATLAAEAGVPFHVDAVAAFGHVPIDFEALRRGTGSRGSGLVALSVSAHKIGGPVGIGALVLSRHAEIVPLMHGGGQQRDVRSGTQDVPAAVSFAVAATAADDGATTEAARLKCLQRKIIEGISALVPDAVLSGPEAESPDRVTSTVHYVFPGAQGDSILFLLDAAGVCVSTGSACQAGIPEPSHVVMAMGRTEQEARGSIRITMGRTTTDSDVEALLAALPAAYAQASRAGLAERKSRLAP